MKKKLPWFEIILIIVFMSIQIYAALSDGYNFPNTWFSRDDAYYYFKVAQNIGEGHGSTFDGIHSTNGYHPLWMLICIPVFALARFDLILPLRILLLVMSALTLATAIILYRLLKEALSPPVGVFAAIYWVFDFYVQIVFYRPGLESGIALFFIVLLLYQLFKFERNWRKTNPSLKQLAVFGVIAALVALSRLDLVFFCLIIGIWVIFRSEPIRYLLPLDILAIVISTLCAFIWRLGLPDYYNYTPAVTAAIAANLAIGIPVFFFFGLYQRSSSWNWLKIIKLTTIANIVNGGIASSLLLAADGLHLLSFSPIIVLMVTVLIFLTTLVVRVAAYGLGGKSESTPFANPIEQLKQNWRTWTREGSAYFGILGGAISIYMIWNRLVFGTFSPVSGEIKRWWASSGINIFGGQANYLMAFIGLDPQSELNAWQPLTTYLDEFYVFFYHKYRWANPIDIRHSIYPTLLISLVIVVCLLFLIWRQKTIHSFIKLSFIPLFVGSWLQIFSYSTTGYSSPKTWYWLTEQLVLMIIVALLIDLIYKFFLKRANFVSFAFWGLVGLYGVFALVQYSQDVGARMQYGFDSLDRPYMDVVPFLESLTLPGDVIGMTGGGNVGYFIHDRTIVNMDGLINSYDYFQALKNGTSADYLYDSGMRYIFANPDILNSQPYRGQYDNRLEPITDWGGKDLMRLLPKPAQ